MKRNTLSSKGTCVVETNRCSFIYLFIYFLIDCALYLGQSQITSLVHCKED